MGERDEPVVVWVLSGRSEQALANQAQRLLAHVADDADMSVLDVGWSLVATRSVFEHRAVLVGGDRAALMGGWRTWRPVSRVRVWWWAGRSRRARRYSCFPAKARSGWGWDGSCMAGFRLFAQAFDEAAAALDGHLRLPLKRSDVGCRRRVVGEHRVCAAGVVRHRGGLAALWQSWGVVPDVVMGHSVGEITAAYVAGVLSLQDAAKVVAARGRLMAELPVGGVMVAVTASEAEVAPLLSEGVSIAAVNGPNSVVISGEQAAVGVVADRLAGMGRRVHRLAVSHAFHSIVDGADAGRVRPPGGGRRGPAAAD